jgi:hypothetical protein
MTHEKGHSDFWEELQRRGDVPRDEEYDEHPRGRVSCDTKRKQFFLFLDRCILSDARFAARIIRAMHLPPSPMTEISLDSHYRCPACMPEYGPDNDDDL